MSKVTICRFLLGGFYCACMTMIAYCIGKTEAEEKRVMQYESQIRAVDQRLREMYPGAFEK